MASPNWQTRIKDELYEKIEGVIERGFPGRAEFLEHAFGLYELTILKTKHPEIAAELEEVIGYTRRINTILLNMAERIIAQKHFHEQAIADGERKTGQAFEQAADSSKEIERLQTVLDSMQEKIAGYQTNIKWHEEAMKQLRNEKELEKDKALLALRSEFLEEGNKMRLENEQLKMRLERYEGSDQQRQESV